MPRQRCCRRLHHVCLISGAPFRGLQVKVSFVFLVYSSVLLVAVDACDAASPRCYTDDPPLFLLPQSCLGSFVLVEIPRSLGATTGKQFFNFSGLL